MTAVGYDDIIALARVDGVFTADPVGCFTFNGVEAEVVAIEVMRETVASPGGRLVDSGRLAVRLVMRFPDGVDAPHIPWVYELLAEAGS